MPIRIAIDATRIGRKRSGIENSALSVLQALPHLLNKHTDWQVLVLSAKNAAGEIRDAVPRLCTRVVLYEMPVAGSGWFKEQVLLPWVLGRQPTIDLFYSPGYPISPLVRARKIIIQVHDLVPWRCPNTMTAGSRLYWRTLLPQTIRRASRVVTVSKFTAAELREFAFAKGKTVDVLYNAVHARYLGFSAYEHTPAVLSELGIPTPYFLCVGNLEPRKNLLVLLEAFAQYIRDNPDAQESLVFVGAVGWKNANISSALTSYPYRHRLVFAGWVLDDELVHLVSGARALLFPSIYEGFGLPPLEAVATGTPAVVSDVASMPEIMGDFALYAHPHEPDQWARLMRQVVCDNQYRQAIAENGRKWARRYCQDVFSSHLDAVLTSALQAD